MVPDHVRNVREKSNETLIMEKPKTARTYAEVVSGISKTQKDTKR